MRSLSLLALILCASAFLIGQERTPKAEIGFGYSYSRARVPNSTARANMHGILITGVGNVNKWLGVEAELAAHMHCITECPGGDDDYTEDEPYVRNQSLSFLVGPKIRFYRNRKVSPWVHSIFGVTSISYTNDFTDVKLKETGFGMAAGGGVDINFRTFAVRAIQIDYARFAGAPNASNNIRIGCGVVLRLGHKAARK